MARTWTVGGMDCAACASKIRGALERLPGVTDVQISVMSERLTLKLAGASTPPDEIERQVRRLGYSVSPNAVDGGRAGSLSGTRSRPDLGDDIPPSAAGQGDHADHGHERASTTAWAGRSSAACLRSARTRPPSRRRTTTTLATWSREPTSRAG